MKYTLKTLLLLFSAAISISMALLSCDSYERRMARFEKVADEYKSTLGPENRILAEIIDSVAQKVFYLVSEEGNENIIMHDYSTNETMAVLPKSGEIEDYEFCGIEILDTKLIKDRLFVSINSICMWRLGMAGVFYVDIRDNSLHYVESCNDASFRGNSEIAITKFYYLGEDEYGEEETKREEYTLSTSLSDEGYADNRWEQKRKEERLAEEWRTRDIERMVKFDYTVYSNIKFDDHIGNLSKPIVFGMVHTKVYTVPNNKVWVFKRFSTSGYGVHSPILRYHKVNNGHCENLYGNTIEWGQVLYSGQYLFSIEDLSCNTQPGHRTAIVKFSEEMY